MGLGLVAAVGLVGGGWDLVLVTLLIGALVLLPGLRREVVGGEGHRKSSSCAGCRYDLSGHDGVCVCPECGRADARWRVPLDEVQYHFRLRGERVWAFMLLEVWVVGVELARHTVLASRIGWWGYRRMRLWDFRKEDVQWVCAPLLMGVVAVWVMSLVRGRVSHRVWVAGLVYGCVMLWHVSVVRPSFPLAEYADLQTESSALACVALGLGVAASWCARGSMTFVVRSCWAWVRKGGQDVSTV